MAIQIAPKPSKLDQAKALFGGKAVPQSKAEVTKTEKVSAPAARDLDIEVASIRPDQSAQPRETLNNDRIAEYAEAMKAGDQFPPLVVFRDADGTWLADGFHRLYAAQQAGKKLVRCIVHPGGLREAILHSVGANATHGQPRSDTDKERAVLRMLSDEIWSTWTDREIAKRCRVSHTYVANIRKKHAADTGNVASMDRTFVHPKTGKATTMKTAGINAGRKNAPKALNSDEPSPEAGPQAEASQSQDTGVGTLADREGRFEGEAASADLPTNLQSADGAIAAVTGKAQLADADSVEPSSADPLQSAWDAASGDKRQAFLARNNLTIKRQVSPAVPTAKAKAGDAPPPASPATIRKTLSKADQTRLLRPNCKHADDLEKCAGDGRKHCRACELRADGGTDIVMAHHDIRSGAA